MDQDVEGVGGLLCVETIVVSLHDAQVTDHNTSWKVFDSVSSMNIPSFSFQLSLTLVRQDINHSPYLPPL